MAEARDQVTLKVGGQAYRGWKAVSIERGIDHLCGRFSLSITERWPDQPQRWIVEAGSPCQVLIGEDPVITGHVDETVYSADPRSHPISIAGRDRTADLVDCSAVHDPGSWTDRTMDQIAAELARPFGITVTAAADVGARFKRFALQQGETVFEAIDRMARLRGVLAVTTPAGDLELRRPGQAEASYRLELGVNLVSISARDSVEDRFSRYVLKGQAAGDGVSGTAAARPKAEAADPGVRRHRPLMILNAEQSTAAALGERARWEASVRAARGREVQAVVAGWRSDDGDLYLPDRVAEVEAAAVGVSGRLLVSAVQYGLDERGQVAVLTLVPKAAFSLLAQPERSVA